jgi:hypothetical protein
VDRSITIVIGCEADENARISSALSLDHAYPIPVSFQCQYLSEEGLSLTQRFDLISLKSI